MTISPVMFSSATDQWSTPRSLIDELSKRHTFVLDVCADASNCVAEHYFGAEMDGLKQDWVTEASKHPRSPRNAIWMNPPYGRQIGKWVAKAAETGPAFPVVCLLPARTDTTWWHKYIWEMECNGPRLGVQINFLKGRLKFGSAKAGAPFPSVIVTFR